MPRYLFQGQEDSANQRGPTLQRLADRAELSNTKRQALESLFDVAAPMAMYSPEAEASWAGVLSKTANLKKLEKAKELLSSGKSAQDVWKQTGWGLSPEGKWMYEISDDKMRLRPDFDRLPKDPKKFNAQRITDMSLGSILEHPELQKAYPELFSNTRVTELHKKPEMFANMKPSASWKSGISGNKYWPSTPNEVSVSASTPEQVLSNLVHEVGSHGTAQYSGFSKGSNEQRMQALLDAAKKSGDLPTQQALGTNAYQAYLNNFGEANARLAQARMSLTPEQRLAQFPWESDYFEQMTGSPLNKLHGYE